MFLFSFFLFERARERERERERERKRERLCARSRDFLFFRSRFVARGGAPVLREKEKREKRPTKVERGRRKQQKKARSSSCCWRRRSRTRCLVFCVKASTIPLSKTLMKSNIDARAPKRGVIVEGEGRKGAQKKKIGDAAFSFFFLVRREKKVCRHTARVKRQGASSSLSYLSRVPSNTSLLVRQARELRRARLCNVERATEVLERDARRQREEPEKKKS